MGDDSVRDARSAQRRRFDVFPRYDAGRFLDTTLAGAFVARWCAGYRVETAGGVFQVRDDEPAPRVGAALHRTP
jgi:hypothetical protein